MKKLSIKFLSVLLSVLMLASVMPSSVYAIAAEQLDDGKIVLVDEKTGEVVYTITIPYMVDANGKHSDKVDYSLEQVKNKEYSITVTADSEWMNDESRAFPVTIDPPITADSSAR